jgi:hypothetical protein
MKADPLTLLVIQIKIVQDMIEAKAIRVDRAMSAEFPLGTRHWWTSLANPRRVHGGQEGVDLISPVFDSENLEAAFQENISQMIHTSVYDHFQNLLELTFERCHPVPTRRFFVSTTNPGSQSEFEVEVELMIRNLGESPDLRAYAEWSLRLQRAVSLDSILGTTAFGTIADETYHEIVDIAEMALPIPGLFLPFEVSEGDYVVSGVLRLGEKLSAQRFLGTLFCLGDTKILRPGSVLGRRVDWMEKTVPKSIESDIARVLQIGESVP